jgi:hypothetical protein
LTLFNRPPRQKEGGAYYMFFLPQKVFDYHYLQGIKIT